MRWLFLFVLSLNIVYVVWQVNVPAKDVYAEVPMLQNVEPIILIRELEHDGRGELISAIEDLAPEFTGSETQSETVAVSEAGAAQSERCFTLGPFREKGQLQSLQKEIQAYVVMATIRSREEKGDSVYWVYIQPEKDRKAAIRLGKRLKSKRIKDFYVIRKGEKNNGISLGHFKDSARAFELESKVKKLGFNAKLDTIHKTQEVFWLDYQLIDTELPEEVVKKYTQSSVDGHIGRLSRDCSS